MRLYAIATHVEEHDVRLNHDALVPNMPQFETYEEAVDHLMTLPDEQRTKYFIVNYAVRPEIWDMRGRTNYAPDVNYFDRIYKTLNKKQGDEK
jgi:hypothetical protein